MAKITENAVTELSYGSDNCGDIFRSYLFLRPGETKLLSNKGNLRIMAYKVWERPKEGIKI